MGVFWSGCRHAGVGLKKTLKIVLVFHGKRVFVGGKAWYVFGDFFGRRVYTTNLIPSLHSKTKAPIVSVAIHSDSHTNQLYIRYGSKSAYKEKSQYNAKTMNVVLDVVNESIVYHNQMHNVTFMLKLYAIRNRIKFCINFFPHKILYVFSDLIISSFRKIKIFA